MLNKKEEEEEDNWRNTAISNKVMKKLWIKRKVRAEVRKWIYTDQEVSDEIFVRAKDTDDWSQKMDILQEVSDEIFWNEEINKCSQEIHEFIIVLIFY